MRRSSRGYSMEIINSVYENVPAFTDIFDEETWYAFVVVFVLTTIVIAFILSRFITLDPGRS